jgi:hypothetical protein
MRGKYTRRRSRRGRGRRAYETNPVEPFNENVVRVAQMISFGLSEYEIRHKLISDGFSEEDSYLIYNAAKVYERNQENPVSSEMVEVAVFGLGTAALVGGLAYIIMRKPAPAS